MIVVGWLHNCGKGPLFCVEVLEHGCGSLWGVVGVVSLVGMAISLGHTAWGGRELSDLVIRPTIGAIRRH